MKKIVKRELTFCDTCHLESDLHCGFCGADVCWVCIVDIKGIIKACPKCAETKDANVVFSDKKPEKKETK